MRSVKDIAWLAGIVEGEGCLSNGTSSITLTIQMTDLDVMERAASLIGTKVSGPYGNGATATKRRKPLYHVTAHGPLAASWVMTLYPTLGQRRQAKARELLVRWKTQGIHNKDKENCKHGHPLSGDNLRVSKIGRVCRTCQAAAMRRWKEKQHSNTATEVSS